MSVDCKLYVDDLLRDITEKSLNDPLCDVWVARIPTGFAFVEFEDSYGADEAVRSLDGQSICGSRARVEHSPGRVCPKHWVRGPREPPRWPSRKLFNCLALAYNSREKPTNVRVVSTVQLRICHWLMVTECIVASVESWDALRPRTLGTTQYTEWSLDKERTNERCVCNRACKWVTIHGVISREWSLLGTKRD